MRQCTHCELAVAIGAPLAPIRREIEAALAAAGCDRAAGATWRLSAIALRNAAWALAHSWREDAWRPERPVAHDVTLGVIGRPSDLPAITTLARLGGFSRTIVVLDGEGPAPAAPPRMLISMRPLAGDFAAQRNHVQSLAETDRGGCGWVMQLDTDECPSRNLLDSVGWMTRAADRDRLRSIGLPRRNLVDGIASALFPDIQYRLNRADIRFANTVHERPVVPFAQSTLGLAGVIEHRLDPVRVRTRSVAYEAMHPGAGRPADEEALLQPFDPVRMRFS